MSLLMVKSVLALFFLAAGVTAVISMFALMGKSERKISGAALRRTHITAGIVFTLLLAVLTYLCTNFVVVMGDELSLRAVFHSVLALGLIVVLGMKIAIVQYFRELIRFVPSLGMIVFGLAFLVFFTSAGYYFLRLEAPVAAVEEITLVPQADLEGNMDRGRALYETKCFFCHYPDREDSKMGPGLKDVLKKDTLPYSNRNANRSNIRSQLRSPVSVMPSFASLSEQQVADLLAYLETL